jgi:predicted transcriptional regulator
MESKLEKIIIEKLNSIEKDLTYIKQHMMEKEDVLSEEEFNAYIRSFDKENLISLKDSKKQLGL